MSKSGKKSSSSSRNNSSDNFHNEMMVNSFLGINPLDTYKANALGVPPERLRAGAFFGISPDRIVDAEIEKQFTHNVAKSLGMPSKTAETLGAMAAGNVLYGNNMGNSLGATVLMGNPMGISMGTSSAMDNLLKDALILELFNRR